MPYIALHVGKELTCKQKEDLQHAIGDLMPIIPGKTRENTMVHISADCDMYMADQKLACTFVDLRLFKAAPMEKKESFTKALTDLLKEQLGIDGKRVYMNITELDHWGSDGVYR